MTPSARPPSADASYLRRLLDRQPACLVRARLDGVLLACSDAALSLFGVVTLGGILKTNLTDRFVPADRAKWQEFTSRVWANGAASLECHLLPDDGARPVVVQGIALKDHPDGVDSLLLSLRDQSQTHRLEHSIQSAEINRVNQEERQRAARDQVEEANADHRRLEAFADEHQAECQRLMEALAAQTADRERREAKFVELEKRVEEDQLASLGKEREHRARVAALEAALAAAHATRASAHDKHPDQAGQQQPESGDRNRRELADVEPRLKASTAEQARLRALVGDHEIQRERIADEHQAAVATLEQSLALAKQEAALSRDQTRQTLAELRSQLAQALAEQSRLAARVEEHEGEREGLAAEHQRALGALEARKLRVLVGDHEIQRERIAAEHQEAVAALEQSLAFANQEAELSRDLTREALAELRAQLALAIAEQNRLAARVEEHEGERDRLTAEHQRALGALEIRKVRALAGDHEITHERIAAEHQAAVATLEQSLALANQEAAFSRDQARQTLAELRSQLAQALAEQSRLAARVEEHEGERDRLSAEHQRAVGALETRRREALADLRSQLSQALTEQGRVAARAEEEHERERDRMSAEHHRALADLETSKREALAALRSQLSQVLAEQGRLTAQADEDHEVERDRMRAEHQRGIADLESSKRDALAYLHSQLSQTAAEERRLAARAEELERERDRMSIDHARAIADLETRRRDALAELRSDLAQISSAEKSRLAERIEELQRERDRMSADHRRAIADLQTSKAEALAECERLLTEIHQALLFKDGVAGIEQRLIDTIAETEKEKADRERLAELQGGLTLAISEMQTVLAHDDALKERFEADDASVRERAERTQDEATVAIKTRPPSTEDSK